MQTFQDRYKNLQRKTDDVSSSRLQIFKDDLNEGATQFMNRLGRKVEREYITSTLKANRQYYQIPYGVLRVHTLRVLVGSVWYTPELVFSEDDWNALNRTTITSTVPTNYFIRGFAEIGIFPIPPADNPNAMEVSYDPAHVDLTYDDYTIGTVQVTNNSVTVIGTGTAWTDLMIGRWIQVNNEGKSYRIVGVIDATHLSLENFYEGDSNSTLTYRIGEVFKIPKGYQKAPEFYAMEQWYIEQEDEKMAAQYAGRFEKLLKEARATYAHSASRMGVKTKLQRRKGRGWIDLQPPIAYP